MTKVATMKLIVATPITIISKSLTMISMRVVTPFLYRAGLPKNFTHSLLVLMALSMVLSNFVKGPMRSNTIH